MAVVGYGVDIIELERVERMLADHPERFVERTFTSGELGHADARGVGRLEALAGRFAAKEAVMKALGTGWRQGVAFREIEILQHPSGEPYVVLHGRTAEVARERGIARIWVSISHIASVAMAGAIAVDEAG